MSETCPAEHLTPECKMYGSAYYHGIIRCLWMHQLAAWGLYPYVLEQRDAARAAEPEREDGE